MITSERIKFLITDIENGKLGGKSERRIVINFRGIC